MINRTDVIVALAESEMVRGPLNNWEKFKLPKPNKRINTLLEQLGDSRAAEGREKKDKRADNTS